MGDVLLWSRDGFHGVELEAVVLLRAAVGPSRVVVAAWRRLPGELRRVERSISRDRLHMVDAPTMIMRWPKELRDAITIERRSAVEKLIKRLPVMVDAEPSAS